MLTSRKLSKDTKSNSERFLVSLSMVTKVSPFRSPKTNYAMLVKMIRIRVQMIMN